MVFRSFSLYTWWPTGSTTLKGPRKRSDSFLLGRAWLIFFTTNITYYLTIYYIRVCFLLYYFAWSLTTFYRYRASSSYISFICFIRSIILSTSPLVILTLISRPVRGVNLYNIKKRLQPRKV